MITTEFRIGNLRFRLRFNPVNVIGENSNDNLNGWLDWQLIRGNSQISGRIACIDNTQLETVNLLLDRIDHEIEYTHFIIRSEDTIGQLNLNEIRRVLNGI